MNIRKANLNDPHKITDLINTYAAEGAMLPRALNDIYENLRDFFVCEKKGTIVGCAALHVCWEGLGEVRSLAVKKAMQKQGIGLKLVGECLLEARQMGMSRVFTLTFEPAFFVKMGFKKHQKEKLPHKIWTDCLNCPHFPNCDETALIIDL